MSMFHERLKELRDESGETQSKIAEALNITPQSLSYYVNGREPNFDLLIKIAEYFHVSVDYLIGKSNCKHLESEPVFEKFGVSEEAISNLELLPCPYHDIIGVINVILENEDSWHDPECSQGVQFLDALLQYFNFEQIYPNTNYAIYSDGYVVKESDADPGNSAKWDQVLLTRINIAEAMRPVIIDKIMKSIDELKEQYNQKRIKQNK